MSIVAIHGRPGKRGGTNELLFFIEPMDRSPSLSSWKAPIAMTTNTDEQVMRQFAAGARNALAELARRFEGPMLGMAAGLLGEQRELACDAVQETWLRVIRFAGKFDGRSSVKTWLYRILINQCCDLRRICRAAATSLNSTDKPAHAPVAESVGTEASSRETNHAVLEAVERLPTDQRTVVLLCYHAGMTHAQAAEILEIPVGTLKSRLHAALERLRALLPVESL